jgi:hypothetical protein
MFIKLPAVCEQRRRKLNIVWTGGLQNHYYLHKISRHWLVQNTYKLVHSE